MCKIGGTNLRIIAGETLNNELQHSSKEELCNFWDAVIDTHAENTHDKKKTDFDNFNNVNL